MTDSKRIGPPAGAALGKAWQSSDSGSDYNNIPAELTALPQWVCTNADKIPKDPKTGWNASVTDPATWGTFKEAVAAGRPYIGFVFTEGDPYVGIDLDPKDEEQRKRLDKIVKDFKSYTETSMSGEGAHIIVKGSIQHAAKRDGVEVYDRGRYFIFTGKAINGHAINARQGLLDTLVKQMGGGIAADDLLELEQVDSELSDKQVLDKARSMSKKFQSLWDGKLQGSYHSQSEADYALMGFISESTPDNKQACRLFRQSGLGQRKKAQRDDYLNNMLKQFRAEQAALAEIQFDQAFVNNKFLPSPSSPKYDIRRYDGVEPLPPDWQIKDLIELNTLVEYFGGWGTGKTFLILDQLACIATGKDYHGRPVAQGPVVYFCGEGQRGLSRRLRAWEGEYGIDLTEHHFYICTTPAALCEEGDVQAVIDAIFSTGETPVHVCFDTRSRNFGAGDENSPKDMGQFVKACDIVKNKFGCTVSAVHHPGHMNKWRSRGHSAWQGVLDVSYQISKTPCGKVAVEVGKAPKDFEPPEPFAFQLTQVDLGTTDEDGKPVTSCVLKSTGTPTTPRKRPRGKVQNQALLILQQLESRLVPGPADADGSGVSIIQNSVPVAEWRGKCIDEGINRQSFYDLQKALDKQGFIILVGDHVRSGSGLYESTSP